MENEKEYYVINSKTLAYALDYLGFKYYKFNNPEHGRVYSFRNTKEFREARDYLWALKCRYNPVNVDLNDLNKKVHISEYKKNNENVDSNINK